MSNFQRFLSAIAALVLIGVAWFLKSGAYAALTEMRQLERIPRGRVVSVIEGEVNLSGTARSAGRTVESPHTRTPCFYFLYTKEKKKRDSDGDTKWVEVNRVERFVPFRLVDDSGSILVVPHSRASFNLRRDHFTRKGDYRYSEWRLDDGDAFFTFGQARRRADGYEVSFDRFGEYTPIVSQWGDVGERRDMAMKSLLRFFLALVAISFAVVFACWTFGIHRIVAFLLLVTVIEGAAVTSLGMRLLRADLSASDKRIERQSKRAHKEIQTILSEYNVSWRGDFNDVTVLNPGLKEKLPPDRFERAKGIYGDLAAAVNRHNEVLGRFPERYCAPLFGLAQRPKLALAPELAPSSVVGSVIQEAPVGKGVSGGAAALGGLGAIIASIMGFTRIREKRYVENIPTALTAGVAFGPTEIKGQAEPVEELLVGPVSRKQCMYYQYIIKEKRRSGKRTRWVTTLDKRVHRLFACRDREGSMQVDLDGAEVHSKNKHYERKGNRKYYEYNIVPGDTLYVLGSAIIEPQEGNTLQIAKGDHGFPFIVANTTERDVMLYKARKGFLWLNGALNGFVLCALALFGITASYAATDYLGAALIPVGFLASCVTALMYNDLVFLNNRVRQAWSNISVSLKKRAELVPNLEALTSGYLEHERGLQSALADLRRTYVTGRDFDPSGAEHAITRELLFALEFAGVIERYPDLKASSVAMSLGRELVKLENEIALMRDGYNHSVERYNTRIAQIPEVVLARLFRFRPAQWFRVKLEVKEVPAVAMDTPLS